MEFTASSECHHPAGAAIGTVHLAVVPFLKIAIAASSLADLQCRLRYVPIIMPDAMHTRYPARSKLRKRERLYDCAPILNYDVFVNGTFESQLREYLRGLAESASHLAALGASREQIKEFEEILAGAVERILVERPDQTRH